MKPKIIKKQKNSGGHCLVSIPKEIANKFDDVDFFSVRLVGGNMILSPVEP